MEVPKTDGLKWFGEGFDGFPKGLPEDCVEYVIHVIDPSLKGSVLRDRFRLIQSAANTLVKSLLKDYIWQRDAFALKLARDDGMSFLRGRTNYGDSIEDEWLIVYLLRELSRQFPEAWIKVVDTDGEFLLIEAANALPRWLNPEVADNRVWINGGELLVIPMPKSTSETQAASSGVGNLTTREALKHLTGDRSKLLHARLVEEEAFYRLRNYPKQIAETLHHALVTCPRKVAFILNQNPKFISPTIEAFYLRDPIALLPLQARNKDHLLFPPEDFVTARLKFTKVGYAQLKSQHFPPPPAWDGTLSLGNGPLNSRLEIGMKVTCGIEMLIADPHNQDKKHVRELKLTLDDLQSGHESLPADSEITGWGTSGDDESWMDIDFRDFENKLAGKRSVSNQGEWGDKHAQENLEKIVSRFEDFLDDDAGGEDDEGSDNMDHDDDASDNDSTDQGTFGSTGEDREASFDEDEFTKMMREIMGMPAETMREIMGHTAGGSGFNWKEKTRGKGKDVAKTEDLARHESLNHGKDDEEDEEIQQLTEAMEAELKASGALKLDTMPNKTTRGEMTSSELTTLDEQSISAESNEELEEGEIPHEDFHLVKNLLESFKSQAGAPGPGGNLMGLMGMRLPRDEGDIDKEVEPSTKS